MTLSLRPARAVPGPSSPPAPATIGSWALGERVGGGELCEVFAARPRDAAADLPAGYALKRLRDRWASEPRAVDFLRREALVGRAVRHPNLVPVLAAQVKSPPYFVVMPLLAGRSLAAALASGWRPLLPEALWIVRQVAEALAAMTAAGWMHADVKPANVFLAPAGHATLIDLGFCQRLDEMVSLADRPVLGTASYLAPEMLSSSHPADVRSDLYSLGVTLFELLAGRLPFDADDVASLAAAHRQHLPDPLRRAAPQVPTRAARLVAQLLAKDPLRRPQTPRELVERLAALEIDTFADWAEAC